jgi:hypothetical protein
LKFCASLLALVFLLMISAGSAQAQATRTWISGVGDDVNPCSRTAPCKTFAGAISKTAAGGEIDCLDPGGFGAVTITKAITLDCGTWPGGILSAGTNGVVVNAGANDRVILRNLVINGANTGINGIRFLAGKELFLFNVFVQQVTTAGIDIAQTQAANVVFKHVTVTQGAVGIQSTTSTGAINGTMDDIQISGMTSHGLDAISNTFLTINHLIAARNAGDGVRTDAASTGLIVQDSISHGNNFGFNAVAGSIRLHSNSMIFNNTNLSTSVLSDGTNRSAGNSTTNTPTSGAFTVN